ncbi:hypothetical protein [Listeria cossartiae]|uniref:hypothetical protein n=1 Tax=Listeria cossartiae TaxID=2838249 RepID=UPI0016257E90|nr:hypothetical protein [Listeria cossartiae]MBC1545402.1 hypothetical protein [Listeria cossartiae subsp. cossartiae]MBC1551051.1 hypothetical protein [Listeria cossartiae subsp. cossartiae]
MSLNIKIIRCYSSLNESVVLDFMPCKEEDYDFIYDFYEETNTEFLRIHQTDYTKLLVPYLKQLFPLIDPITLELQHELDVCFDNLLSKKDWQKLLDILTFEVLPNAVNKEIPFYESFIFWNKEQLDYYDMIMVEGNQ